MWSSNELHEIVLPDAVGACYQCAMVQSWREDSEPAVTEAELLDTHNRSRHALKRRSGAWPRLWRVVRASSGVPVGTTLELMADSAQSFVAECGGCPDITEIVGWLFAPAGTTGPVFYHAWSGHDWDFSEPHDPATVHRQLQLQLACVEPVFGRA